MTWPTVRSMSPHYNSRDGIYPQMVVLHADASKSAMSTVNWLKDPKSRVSYHYVIARTGLLYIVVEEDQRAWHAGRSTWPGVPIVRKSVNHAAIGVALSNRGDGEPYGDIQYEAAGYVVADICRRHHIPAHMIRGHYEVSPKRKSDPYKYFDWPEFWHWFGYYSHGDLGPQDITTRAVA